MKLFYYAGYIYQLLFTKTKLVTDTADSLEALEFKPEIELVIFDLDDTLAGHHAELDSNIKEYLSELLKTKKVAVLSNSRYANKAKQIQILEQLGVYCSPFISKPAPEGFVDVFKHFNSSPVYTAMVGDLIISDMYGAWRLGVRQRILVRPYSSIGNQSQADILLRTVRNIERWLYRNTRQIKAY